MGLDAVSGCDGRVARWSPGVAIRSAVEIARQSAGGRFRDSGARRRLSACRRDGWCGWRPVRRPVVGAPAAARRRRRAGEPRASWLAGAAWRGGRGRRVVRRCAGAGSAGSWVRRSASSPSRQSGCVQALRSWAISESSSQTALSANSRNGRFSRPVLLGGADAVLGVCAAAVQALELDSVAGEVGQCGLEAVPVDVGERQLRARVRTLAAHNHARAIGPVIEVEHGA